ncbi:MAG: response regulator transcription factor [Elusimicrobia bacterium]|nr:response regulator transcription factor [Elusimicrobiota bacterium]
MRILVIEDDRKISAFVADGLKGAGFAVDCAYDGQDGLAAASTAPYAAIVLDLMLPGLDGLSLAARLRAGGLKTPVIILSAKRSVDDRVKGLRAGGDDYLTKPFSFSELLARVEALIRRASHTPESSALELGDLRLDPVTREVVRAGRRLDLPVKEFALLEFLLRNAGRPVSKAMILENVWGYDFDPQTNVVDVLVCRLRDKLDKPFKSQLLQTIRGVGYVLKKP